MRRPCLTVAGGSTRLTRLGVSGGVSASTLRHTSCASKTSSNSRSAIPLSRILLSGSLTPVEVDSPSSGGELVTALVVVVWTLAVERHTAQSQPLLVARCRQIARVGRESAAAGVAFAVSAAVTAPCSSR